MILTTTDKDIYLPFPTILNYSFPYIINPPLQMTLKIESLVTYHVVPFSSSFLFSITKHISFQKNFLKNLFISPKNSKRKKDFWLLSPIVYGGNFLCNSSVFLLFSNLFS